MKVRQRDPTVTPHWIITDTRIASRPQTVKKLLILTTKSSPPGFRAAKPMTEPEKRPVKVEKAIPPKKQNFTSFVSDFSRIHGMNYKEALQSSDVKNLYKSFNRTQNGQEFFVKHSYEQKRPVYTSELRKVGETVYVDNRMSTDQYEPKEIKELEKSQQKLQIARGLYADLKRNYLNDVRADFRLSNYFRSSGHTQESFSPLTDAIVKSILEGAIKQRTKNIFSISPFIETSVFLHSFDKYQSLLSANQRNLIETPLTTFSEESIRRLNSSVEAQNNTDEFDSSDTFFFNTSSYFYGNQSIADIIDYKLSNDQRIFDVYFTDASKKWNTLADFYSSDLGEKLVFAIATGTDAEKEELLAGLKDANFSQNILQEDTNLFLGNLNQTLTNMAGDNRTLLTQIIQSQQRKDEGMIYYEFAGGQVQNGDFFKTNRSSKLIYRFNTMHPDTAENKFKIFVYDTDDDIVQLRKSYVKKNLQKINFLLDTKSQYITSLEKLSETISEPTIAAILAQQEIPIKPEVEDTPDEGQNLGEGMLGGSIVKRLDDFKRRFNPDFKYFGRSGIEHVYKLSF